MAFKPSPFLNPGPIATADSLAIIHLKRDHQIPTILRDRDDDDDGYSEGKVLNTRFGSFPHSTLIGLPWGSQVRASVVDTGSRGRRNKDDTKKRKRDEADDGSQPGEDTPTAAKEAVTASSGFVHLLPPTPENWTSSLPHRTQVVYTPDYSYILHRLRARPGTRIIEAGAGSGSFTHAAARAVYSGYPSQCQTPASKKRKLGKVFSYEFHEQRYEKLQIEIRDHGLDEIVQITHRDVCKDGFGLAESPNVEAVFLDLPAPWLALPHLSRLPTESSKLKDTETAFISPLDPNASIHICTFSPCIEQVQRTISTLRQLGWVDISMIEIAQKRLEIRRERIGIVHQVHQHGLQSSAANVDEAITRLREVEGRFRNFHEDGVKAQSRARENPNSKAKIIESLVDRKVYKEGRLVHRSEPELKTHTSYLVFAVLPREWTDEDEEKAKEMYPVKGREVNETASPISKRQLKKAARRAHQEREAEEAKVGNGGNAEDTTDGGVLEYEPENSTTAE